MNKNKEKEAAIVISIESGKVTDGIICPKEFKGKICHYWDKSKLMKEIASDIKHEKKMAGHTDKTISLHFSDYKRFQFKLGKPDGERATIFNKIGLVLFIASVLCFMIHIHALVKSKVNCDAVSISHHNISANTPPELIEDYARCAIKYYFGTIAFYAFSVGIPLLLHQIIFRSAKYQFLSFCFPQYYNQRMQEKAEKDIEWKAFVLHCVHEHLYLKQVQREQKKTLRYKKREINSLFKSLLKDSNDPKISAIVNYISLHFPIKDE